jgi:hypothetical protein
MALLHSVPDFQTANPLYAAATVKFWAADSSGNRLDSLATLYADAIGIETAENPLVLDGEGKFPAPIFVKSPVVAEVSGPNIDSHFTGLIYPVLGYGGTSTTSLTIGEGEKAFTTQPGLAYQVGTRVRAASASAPTTKLMDGVVTAYSGTSLTVDVDLTEGSGTVSDWKFSIAGARGGTGPQGPQGPKGDKGDLDFTAAGIGAVTMPAQDKMRQIVSPLDYGAAATTDDTEAFEKAREALPSVSTIHAEGEFLLGGLQLNHHNLAGGGTLKKASAASEVLQLGLGDGWRYRSVKDYFLIGDDDWSSPNDAGNGIVISGGGDAGENAGRWTLHNLYFRHFDKAIVKPAGNIGQKFDYVSIQRCNYGYHFTGNPGATQSGTGTIMQPGCDYILGGEISHCFRAGFYLDGEKTPNGQTVFQSTIFEENIGFGVFARNYEVAYTPLTFNDVWWESNGIYQSASTTSLAIGVGSKAFETEAGLSWQAGMRVRAISDGDETKWMEGAVASYSGTTLTITVDQTNGTGTLSDWTLHIRTVNIDGDDYTPRDLRLENVAHAVINRSPILRKEFIEAHTLLNSCRFDDKSEIINTDNSSVLRARDVHTNAVDCQPVLIESYINAEREAGGEADRVWMPPRLQKVITPPYGCRVAFANAYNDPDGGNFFGNATVAWTSAERGVLYGRSAEFTLPAGKIILVGSADISAGEIAVYSVDVEHVSGPKPSISMEGSATLCGNMASLLATTGRFYTIGGIAKVSASITGVGLYINNTSGEDCVLRLACLQVIAAPEMAGAVGYYNLGCFADSA